ncbi:chitinase N-terminal domain-containing protein [Clostridium massiliamazoniense]|uniref:chitinase N-terminal domain-containing protein n=1 Tax=Clostridium massiliamazoniense TaxID=1347366 RepID=UPI0006D84D57|nr:chitinase N-terminal domain-containing protein [Clostridium massiliamazoniense]
MKRNLKKITATFMSFLFLFTLVLVDGKVAYALAKPATPNLQHNNWSGEPNYEITMNIWWGENGDKWRLYENNKLIHEESLVNQSPQAQSASFKITGKAKGTYSYKCELVNGAGVSESSVINVTVTKEVDNSKPEVPSNLKAMTNGENSIIVTWNKVDEANSYELEVDGTVNSINGEQYNHEGLKAGSTHSYRVRSKMLMVLVTGAVW